MDEPREEGVLPHEQWAELERDDLLERSRRPRAMPSRLPTGGGGEETSRHYSTLRLAIPLASTVGAGLLLLYAGPLAMPALGTLPLWAPPGATKAAWVVAAVVGVVIVAGLALLWAFRDRLAELWSRHRAARLRRMRRDLILGAFARDCQPMTQVGVRYGLQRSDPPGSFHDFIGFADLLEHGMEIWWAKGKQAGGFLIPRSWIVRIWPVEMWTKGASPSALRPPDAMVPYVEFRDPRSSGVRILSFESAEEVTPKRILDSSLLLGDRMCHWLYGKPMGEVWVPPWERDHPPGGFAQVSAEPLEGEAPSP